MNEQEKKRLDLEERVSKLEEERSRKLEREHDIKEAGKTTLDILSYLFLIAGGIIFGYAAGVPQPANLLGNIGAFVIFVGVMMAFISRTVLRE